MQRIRYIRVPKDKEAMHAYDYGMQTKEQIEEYVLDDEQYYHLESIGVFNALFQACGSLIGDYEEEVLELNKIPDALKVVDQMILQDECDELLTLKKALELALVYKTLVGFDF